MQLVLTRDEELNRRIKICTANMEKWGYTLPKKIVFMVNPKPTRYYGQCVYDYHSQGYIAIKLNPAIIKTGYDYIMPTIYHELIHAILPRGVHHGYQWIRIADRVSALSGYTIQRCTAHKEDIKNEINKLYPYILKCEKCGKIFGYSRMNNLVRNAGKITDKGEPWCWHSADKGALIRIK